MTAFLSTVPLSFRQRRQRAAVCRIPRRVVVRSCTEFSVESPVEPPETPTDSPFDTIDANTRNPSVAELKAELFAQISTLNRGFLAGGAERESVESVLEELEKANPSETPFEDLDLINGEWRLVYTNARDILSLSLAAPVAQVAQVYQNIEARDNDVFDITNIVEFEPPFAPLTNSYMGSSLGRITVAAKGTRQSVRRVDIVFNSVAIKPVTIAGIEIPAQLPALKFPLGSPVGYIDTTFLDEDIRIARAPPIANQNTVFVLARV